MTAPPAMVCKVVRESILIARMLGPLITWNSVMVSFGAGFIVSFGVVEAGANWAKETEPIKTKNASHAYFKRWSMLLFNPF